MTPTTALVQRDPQMLAANMGSIEKTVLSRADLEFFGKLIQEAGLIPFDKNVPAKVQYYRVLAKVCAGVAHGFDPVSAQENMHVIQGRCVLSARGMAIKLRRTGRYDTRIEKLDETGCKLAVLERNDEGKWILKGHVEFNKTHADKAKLTTSNASMYDKWGPDMFYANAIKRVVRRFAPEVMDTLPLDYRVAKEADPPPQVAPVSAPAQIASGQAVQAEPVSTEAEDVGAEYVEREYIEQVPDEVAEALADSTIDGDFVEASGNEEYTEPGLFSPEDGMLEDLRISVGDLLKEVGTVKAKAVMGDKKLAELGIDDLKAVHSTLLN